MWIFNMDGFFSVVEHRDHPSMVLVRARYQKDLETVAKKVGARMWPTPDQDYPYRLFCSKKQWVKYIAHSAAKIDYDNFKNAALKNADDRRSAQYHEVWATMAGWRGVIPKNFDEEDGYE